MHKAKAQGRSCTKIFPTKIDSRSSVKSRPHSPARSNPSLPFPCRIPVDGQNHSTPLSVSLGCRRDTRHARPTHLLLHHPSRASAAARPPVAPPVPARPGRLRNDPEQLGGLVGDGPVPMGHVLAIRVVAENLGGGKRERERPNRTGWVSGAREDGDDHERNRGCQRYGSRCRRVADRRLLGSVAALVLVRREKQLRTR